MTWSLECPPHCVFVERLLHKCGMTLFHCQSTPTCPSGCGCAWHWESRCRALQGFVSIQIRWKLNSAWNQCLPSLWAWLSVSITTPLRWKPDVLFCVYAQRPVLKDLLCFEFLDCTLASSKIRSSAAGESKGSQCQCDLAITVTIKSKPLFFYDVIHWILSFILFLEDAGSYYPSSFLNCDGQFLTIF